MSFFEVEEPADANSFSDHRRSGSENREVSITGQCVRGTSLEWLQDLRSALPSRTELKSDLVLKKFSGLNRELKYRVRLGLRKVRVHIFDTLAYQAKENQIYRSVLTKDRSYRELKESALKGNTAAKLALKLRDQKVAFDILWDSPSERLKRQIRALDAYGYGLRRFMNNPEDEYRFPDLSQFVRKSGSLERVVAKYASQEAAVFFETLEDVERRGIFYGSYEAKERVSEMLSRSHAFDEGDKKNVEMIDERRREFIRSHRGFAYDGVSELYGDIRSHLSPHTQAADIAVAFANQAYERNGIKQIVDDFDYATLNGERLTEDNVDERIRFWNDLRNREQKYQKFLNS